MDSTADPSGAPCFPLHAWRRLQRCDLAGRSERWLVRVARRAGCAAARAYHLDGNDCFPVDRAKVGTSLAAPPRELLERRSRARLHRAGRPGALADWLGGGGFDRVLVLRLEDAGPRPLLFLAFDPPDEWTEHLAELRGGVESVLELDVRQRRERWGEIERAALQQRLRVMERRFAEESARRHRYERMAQLRESLRLHGFDIKSSLRSFAEHVAVGADICVVEARRGHEGSSWIVRAPSLPPEHLKLVLERCTVETEVRASTHHGVDVPLPSPRFPLAEPEVHVCDGLRLTFVPAGRDTTLDPGWLAEATAVLAEHLHECDAREVRRSEDAGRERLLEELRAGLRLGRRAGDSFEDLAGAARWLWDLRQAMRADAALVFLQEKAGTAPLVLASVDGDGRQREALLGWVLRRFAKEHSTSPLGSIRLQEVRDEGRRLAPPREVFPTGVPMEDWRSRIAVPFRGSDDGVGLLVLGSRSPGIFAPEVATALRSAASAASRHFSRVQRHERERLSALQKVLGHLRAGVLLVDDAGSVLVANPAVRELLELDDTAFQDLDSFERASGFSLGLVIEEAQSSAQTVVLDLDEIAGRRRHLRVEAKRVESRGADPDSTLLTFVDVTEQKQVERAQAEFVGIVSHELRTPLTSMRTAVDLVQSGETGEIDEQQRHFLNMTLRNIDRMGRLVQQLLDAAQQEGGKLVLRRDVAAMDALLAPTLSALKAAAEKHERVFRVSIPEGSSAYVDADRFVEVLDNLAGNALKFTAPGGRIEVIGGGGMSAPHAATQELADQLGLSASGFELEVRDDGKGMAATAREQAFDRFFQEGDPLADRPAGIGLGLHITRALVAAHDGEISLESEPGRGTQVKVWVPADAATARLHGGIRRLREALADPVTRLGGAVLEGHWLDASAQAEFAGLDVLDAGDEGLTVRLREDFAVRLRRPDATPASEMRVHFPREGRRLGTLLALLLARAFADESAQPV